MKVVFILAFFLSNCFAQTCSELSIELFGEIVFKEKTGKKVYLRPVPKAWNANSDYFETLYLKNESQKNPARVLIFISSRGKADSKKKLSFDLSEEKGLLKLENSNFKKKLLPLAPKPAAFELSVLDSGKNIICSEEFKLEVTP